MKNERTLVFTGENVLESGGGPKCLFCHRRSGESMVVRIYEGDKEIGKRTLNVRLIGLHVDTNEGTLVFPICLTCLSILDFFKNKAIEAIESRKSRKTKVQERTSKGRSKGDVNVDTLELTESDGVSPRPDIRTANVNLGNGDRKPDFMMAYR